MSFIVCSELNEKPIFDLLVTLKDHFQSVTLHVRWVNSAIFSLHKKRNLLQKVKVTFFTPKDPMLKFPRFFGFFIPLHDVYIYFSTSYDTNLEENVTATFLGLFWFIEPTWSKQQASCYRYVSGPF